MAPLWLTVVAWLYLSVCFSCAGVIAYDIALNRRRQPMGVMNFVFPITALYFGPFALALYWHWGRATARTAMASMSMSRAAASRAAVASAGDVMQALGGQSACHEIAGAAGLDSADEPAPPGERARPWWVTMAIEVSHCGSGCTLGDVIAEFAIFWLGLTIAGVTLGAEYAGDYIFALAFGIIFQYFAIAPMRGLGLKDGLVAAAKADFISLTAFEIGLFGWMAVMAFVLFPAPHHLMPSSAAYWLLMQIGMIIGYLTSWPANVWLVNRGIKVPM
ncbi:MAG: rane protein [Actinomycetia bacterium]|nr:rane protein [Actinomycetes bacterium]